MKSIRSQLLGWLLPGFVVVFALACAGVYYSARKAMDADIDARLGKLSGAARMALRNHLMSDSSGARGPALRSFLAKEEFQAPGHYFELWAGDRVSARRSPNLGELHLPRPASLSRDGTKYEATLPNGERVRISAMQFPLGPGETPLEFATAISKVEGESQLSRLLTQLVMGGLGCCAVLCTLLVLALRFALQPLARVGEQASAMDTGSLHERFSTEALPSEIVPIVLRLNALIARLEEGFERERRFNGYLAHELRTPLAAIRSTSEVAAKWPDHSSIEDFHDIARAAKHLQHTVDSLLLLSRLETSSDPGALESVALRSLIEDCLASHLESAKARHLNVEVDLDDDAEVRLETDPQLLRIILNNLISNAVQYAPEDSRISILGGNKDFIFRISNLAPDLSFEDLPRLFERLWRKDVTRGDASHSGLGLSVAKSCAIALGLTLTANLDDVGQLHLLLFSKK